MYGLLVKYCAPSLSPSTHPRIFSPSPPLPLPPPLRSLPSLSLSPSLLTSLSGPKLSEEAKREGFREGVRGGEREGGV